MISLAALSDAQRTKTSMTSQSSTENITKTLTVQTLPTNQGTSKANGSGFNFSGLPPELRLLVYHQLVVPKRHKLFQDQRTERDSATRVDLIMPDPIPPIHSTCRLVHNEAAPIFKKSVPPSKIPRIVFRGSPYTTRCIIDMVDVMEVIDRLLGMRYYPDAHDNNKGRMVMLENSTSLLKDEIKTVQRFVDWNLSYFSDPRGRPSIAQSQAHPIHIVHEDHWRGDQGTLFEDMFGGEICFIRQFPVLLHSLGEPLGEPYEAWEGWFQYGGKLDREIWNAEWA